VKLRPAGGRSGRRADESVRKLRGRADSGHRGRLRSPGRRAADLLEAPAQALPELSRDPGPARRLKRRTAGALDAWRRAQPG